MLHPRPAWIAAVLSLGVAPPALAQLEVRPDRQVVTNVRLSADEGAPSVSLVLRHGRVEAVLPEGADAPAGATAIDGGGLLAVPAFVDAFATRGLAEVTDDVDQDLPVDTGSDVRVDMRTANRRGVRPAFRAVEALAVEAGDAAAWREAGFGAALLAPSGQLLGGTSALAATRDAAARDLVLATDVFAHGSFRAPRGGYPSTLMGYHAQLRQVFLDAQRHVELERREQQGRPGPRPAFDAELDATAAILAGRHTLVVEAETDRDVHRWIKLADTYGFRFAVAGGRDLWKMADLLAARDVPVVLTLDWGEEPDEVEEDEPVAGLYDEPAAIAADRRARWEETRAGAVRLHEAGVQLAFGSGDEDPDALLDDVRALVEVGFPADAALHALTAGAAELLGVDARLGAVATGRDASFGLWTASPLEDGAQLAWLFVDGVGHEYEVEEASEDSGDGPDEGVDLTGTWHAAFEMFGEEAESTLDLEMEEDGSVTGTLTGEDPEGEPSTSSFTGSVSGDRMRGTTTLSFGEFEVDLVVEGTVDGDRMTGTMTMKSEFGDMEIEYTALRDDREVR